MNRRNLVLAAFCVAAALHLCSGNASGQDSVRTIDKPGDFEKFLTPGMVDRWVFEGLKDETVVVHVTTKEFDSVIELVQVADEQEKVLLEVDAEGSNSSLATRLPADGGYKVRVQGFERRGGGNYTFRLQQFSARPAVAGEPCTGHYDPRGKAYLRFAGEPDQQLTVDVSGLSNSGWAVLDPRGETVASWRRLVGLERKGEHFLLLSGQAGRRFEATLRPAARSAWQTGKAAEGSIAAHGAQVINLDCRPDDVRWIDIESSGRLAARVVPAPRGKSGNDKRLGGDKERPELVFLPVASKGGHHRFAFITGRKGRFQLQLQSEAGASYRADYRDPLEPVNPNQSVNGKLPVGGAGLFVLDGPAGQSISVALDSDQFDPMLRIYDSQGHELADNDDGPDGLGSRLRHTAYSPAKLIVMVSSVGDGGGGEFELRFRAEKPERLTPGKPFEKQVGTAGADQWLVEAQAGQTIIFHAGTQMSQPRISLRNQAGVELARSADDPSAIDAVLVHRFADAGTFSIWVELPHGTSYRLQTFAPE